MGSSDLNLKKSWHPSTFKNQERVWKEEQKHKEEERKLEQLKKELTEERQLQELQRMQEDAGSKQRSNKLDWMYASPNANLNGNNNESMEDFLLGKKNVDDLLRAKQKKDVEAATAAEESRFLLSNSNANNERDIQSKIREDPLLMIKKREQMALKAIMENPLKLKELKKKEKKDKKKKSSSEHKHRHHHSDKKERREKESSRDRSDRHSREDKYSREEKYSREDKYSCREDRHSSRDDRHSREDRYSRDDKYRRRSLSPRRR